MIARLVRMGDEWMLTVLRYRDRQIAYDLALELSLRDPEAVYRNLEKLANAWDLQRQDRERFIRFFGDDLVVLRGDEVQDRMTAYQAFCHEEVSQGWRRRGRATPPLPFEPQADLAESDTVALIYDEAEGLGFYADVGMVQAVFNDPDPPAATVLSEDDTVEPLVLRRLAERVSGVFRRPLEKPRSKCAAQVQARPLRTGSHARWSPHSATGSPRTRLFDGVEQAQIATHRIPQVVLRINPEAAVGGTPVALPVARLDPAQMGEARGELGRQLLVLLLGHRCRQPQMVGLASIQGIERVRLRPVERPDAQRTADDVVAHRPRRRSQVPLHRSLVDLQQAWQADTRLR
jgi:hypothetical protein